MVLREERGQRQLKGEIKIERIFSTVRGIRNFECSSFSGFFIKFPTSIFRNSDFMTVRFGFSFFVAVMLAGCVGDVQKRRNADDPVSDSEVLEAMQEYDVSRYFPGNEKDSLLANMVTYIYRRPAKAKAEDRTKPAFRSYYVRSMLQFEYVYHHSPDDSVHYYYLIRPHVVLRAHIAEWVVSLPQTINWNWSPSKRCSILPFWRTMCLGKKG